MKSEGLHNEMKVERDAAVSETCSAGAALAESHKALADEKASADRARAERNEMRIQLGEEAGLRLQAQARETELRAALREAVGTHGEPCADAHCETRTNGLDALAHPADDSALREFGLKVGYRVARRPELRDARDTVEAAVDAVIRGER